MTTPEKYEDGIKAVVVLLGQQGAATVKEAKNDDELFAACGGIMLFGMYFHRSHPELSNRFLETISPEASVRLAEFDQLTALIEKAVRILNTDV